MGDEDRLAQVIKAQIEEEARRTAESEKRAVAAAEKAKRDREEEGRRAKLIKERRERVWIVVSDAVAQAAKDIVANGFISADRPGPSQDPIKIKKKDHTDTLNEIARVCIVRKESDQKTSRYLMISFLWKMVNPSVDPEGHAVVTRYALACLRGANSGRTSYSGEAPQFLASDVTTTWQETKEGAVFGFSKVDATAIRNAITDVISLMKNE